LKYATLTETERRECLRLAVLHVPSSALPDLWRTLRLPEGDFLEKELGRYVRRAFADAPEAAVEPEAEVTG
jgi:hypothetical protein